jgi:hypothetical protein
MINWKRWPPSRGYWNGPAAEYKSKVLPLSQPEDWPVSWVSEFVWLVHKRWDLRFSRRVAWEKFTDIQTFRRTVIPPSSG